MGRYRTHFKGSSNLTVAAEWNTMETSDVIWLRSASQMPRPGIVMSPWMATNLLSDFGLSSLIFSKICFNHSLEIKWDKSRGKKIEKKVKHNAIRLENELYFGVKEFVESWTSV